MCSLDFGEIACNKYPVLLLLFHFALRREEGLDFIKFSVYLLIIFYELFRYSPCHIIQLALHTHFGHGIKYFMS